MALRCPNASDGVAAHTCRKAFGAGRAPFRCSSLIGGQRLSRRGGQHTGKSAGGSDVAELLVLLHAAEATNASMHGHGRIPRCDADAHWMGCRGRKSELSGMDPVRLAFPL